MGFGPYASGAHAPGTRPGPRSITHRVSPSPRVYLSLGSNLGDRDANLTEALERLAPIVSLEGQSSVYETEAWGFEDQPAFLNQVVSGTTELEPEALLMAVKAIEQSMGRESTFRYGPRLIDIDILVYDQAEIQGGALSLPHPRLAQRAFVLIPLAELKPDLEIPGTGATAAELAARAEGAQGVVRRAPPQESD